MGRSFSIAISVMRFFLMTTCIGFSYSVCYSQLTSVLIPYAATLRWNVRKYHAWPVVEKSNTAYCTRTWCRISKPVAGKGAEFQEGRVGVQKESYSVSRCFV